MRRTLIIAFSCLAIATPVWAGEDGLEITWRFAVTPRLAIQPNYQQLSNPGGGSAPKARLLGARINVTL